MIDRVTSEYLALVLHRFMERLDSPLKVRINNEQLRPFNPIPIGKQGVRMVENKSKSFGSDVIKIEGLVLPSTSIDEAESNPNPWPPRPTPRVPSPDPRALGGRSHASYGRIA